MTTNRAALLFVLATTASGCTRLYDTASLDPLASAGGYCRAQIDAHYDFSVRCSGYDPAWSKLRPKYWYHAECDQKAAAVTAGRMTYDRASGEACLAAYGTDTCTEPQWALPACLAAIAPAVLEGGECVSSYDCVGPGGCSSPDGTCPGQCIGFGALGASCDPSTAPCGPGLWCDGTNTCSPRKGQGEGCSSNCMENLSCDAGFCSYVAGAGESCATRSCDPFQPLYCEPGSSICLAIPTYGQACGTGDLCGDGLYCNTSNHLCYPVPTVPQADGQPCPTPYFCAVHSWCDGTLPPAICKPRKAVGAACTDDSQCLQPGRCDTSGPAITWVCKAPAIAGTPCSVGGGCATGTWCHVASGVDGTCTTEPDVGMQCGQIGVGDYASCIQGHCALANPTDTIGTCRLDGAAGAPCSEDYQCESWSCDTSGGTCRPSTCPLSY